MVGGVNNTYINSTNYYIFGELCIILPQFVHCNEYFACIIMLHENNLYEREKIHEKIRQME